MTKQRRNQLIAVGSLIVGLAFLSQPYSILVRGIALPLLIISAILSALSFSEKRIIEVIAGLGLVAGFSFLYLPIPPILGGSAFHLLAASAIAFGMTIGLRSDAAKKIVESAAAIIVVAGLVALYQSFSSVLQSSGLHLILTGIIVLAIVSPRKLLVERVSIGGIVLGLVFLCQPFAILLYQTGFQVLLGGLTGFIVVAHRSA